jgi:ankyrin repeat protein
MYIAAANGRTAVVQALHAAKADINQRDWYAAVASRALMLSTSRLTHSEFQTPLWAASDKGHTSVVNVLIGLGANVSSFNR